MADERSSKTAFHHSQWNRGVQRLRADESTGWRRIGLIALTAAVYFGAARVGLEYAVVAGVVTLTWLPSGLALASLLKLGTGVWPGVAAGAFLTNESIGIPLPVVAGITAGNTLEAVTAAFLFTSCAKPTASLRDVRGVLALVGAAAISAMISAFAGVASLTLGDVIPPDHGLWAWLMWWMGDTTGILIGTPLLMCFPQTPRATRFTPIRFVEATTLAGLLGMGSWIVFRASEFSNAGHYPTAFAVYPFVIWGALRFGVSGAGTVTLIIAFVSILATTHGTGPFVVSTPTYSLIRWWIFNTILATSGLLLGASSEERRVALAALARAKEELEHRVEKRTRALTKANRDLREQIALSQRLEREVIQVSEGEQRKIGQELHDGLGQHLTGVAFLSEALAEELRPKIPDLASQSQEIARLVNESIAMTRAIARGLYPVSLESGGLAGGLQQLASQTRERHGIDCRYLREAEVAIPDGLCAINLFRIAQEAVNNAIRHGRAHRVIIRTSAENGKYRMSVSDDGSGFDPERSAQREGLGLHLMHYRANTIGAILEFRRNPHGGMDVSVVCN